MKIRHQAFEDGKRMLKGGLHCHTTRTDGHGNPEEVIRYHYDHGYDFLAITDHNIYNYENFAPDVPITIIPGFEFGVDNDAGCEDYHTVCLGQEKENGNPYEQDEIICQQTKTPEEHQKFLDKFRANNQLIFYCHPEWSGTPARSFENLQGYFAYEIYNSGSHIENDMDKDAIYWDELLYRGKRLLGVAVDDGHRMTDHCNGWVMVNAENNVKDILDALETGKFYSSCGPEIYDFYVEDNTVVIECSSASMIRLHCAKYPTRVIKAQDKELTRAEFRIGDNFPYVRISIVDKNGKKAWTNPIFLS
ncbi:MAG: PHP domain-containing protein [Clostridia bacterium]|nr:PHP domain-containing protein [Clostridia bacterium]